jgi:hypothetical protein
MESPVQFFIEEDPMVVLGSDLGNFGERTCKLSVGNHCMHFGEHNADNELHGRGIRIGRNGVIGIAHFRNGYDDTPGNYISIGSGGEFVVGENYLTENGQMSNRYTQFNTDGTTDKYGY